MWISGAWYVNSKDKIKEPNIYLYNGIAKRDHCKVMTREVCVSGFEKLLSIIHCGHFNIIWLNLLYVTIFNELLFFPFFIYHEVVCWKCSLFYLVLFCQYLVKHLTFWQFLLHFTQSVKVQIHFSEILFYGFYLFLFSNSIFCKIWMSTILR